MEKWVNNGSKTIYFITLTIGTVVKYTIPKRKKPIRLASKFDLMSSGRAVIAPGILAVI